jgi:flagellar hook-length control protein FliK
MDASMVMSKPAPQPTTPSNSPAFDAHDDGEDFAAHLPSEEATRPPTRRSETRDAAAPGEVAANESEATPQEASADAAMSLTAPVAPVAVRPQNSVVTIDLSAFIAPTTPTDSPSTAPKPAAPQPAGQPAAATTQQTAAAPQAAQTEAAAPEAPPQIMQAQAAKTAPSLESIALPVSPTTPGEARAAPRLRAGRSEATDIQSADARPPASVAAAPGASASPAAAGVQTANAVQPTAAATPTLENAATVDATPVGDAAPAEQRAHSLNETTATQAGHRATTPAALVAQHIIRRFDGRSTSIDVRLDPPELGRVQVSLEVGPDNKVTAVVAAENPATLSDLVRSARELERALQDAGLELDAGGLSFDLAERGENGPSDASSSGKRSGRGDGGSESPMPTPVSRPFGLESWRGARVDVMA